MDFIELCLKIPNFNLGVILYYAIFIVAIPYVSAITNGLDFIKFYMPFVLAAHILTRVSENKFFSGLYELRPKEFIPFLSSNFINIFALFGILWQSVT